MSVDNFVKGTSELLLPLEMLLGKDNVDDVKKRIGNLIVERVASDLRSYDYYLFYPEDYKGAIEEAFEKVNKKIAKMYTDTMIEVAGEAVKRFKDIAIGNFDETKGIQLRSCHKCEHCHGNKCKFYDEKYWIAHDHICAEEGFVQYIKKTQEEKQKGMGYFAT